MTRPDTALLVELGDLEFDRDATTVKGAEKFAAHLNALVRDALNDAAARRGYRTLSSRVSAATVGAPIVRLISDRAESTAWDYYLSGDVAGATLERIARWIDGGACDKCGDGDQDHREVHLNATAAILSDSGDSYGANLGRRIAHQICRRSGTGRGSMATFQISDDQIERAIIQHLRGALVGPIAAFTVAALTCRSCQVGRGCRWHSGALSRRGMTPQERGEVIATYKVERIERAPLYAPLLDGMGDALPNARSGHGVGHSAPGLPERDAPLLRRGSIPERLNAIGAPSYVRRAVALVHDAVNLPDQKGRYRRSAPWGDVVERIDGAPSTDTVRRSTRAFLKAIQLREELGTAAPLKGAPIPTVIVARPTYNLTPQDRRRENLKARNLTPQDRPDSNLNGVGVLAPQVSKGNAHAHLLTPYWTPTPCECPVDIDGAHAQGCRVVAIRRERIDGVAAATTRAAYLDATTTTTTTPTTAAAWQSDKKGSRFGGAFHAA